MPDVDVITAGDTAPAADVLATLTPAERQSWRETGELPSASPKTSTPPEAASTPAEPAAQAASTDASSPPASEPGTPKKANAETRIKELLAENKRLAAQIADASRAGARPASGVDASAASSTAPEVPSLADTIARPDLGQPILTDTAFFARFPEASLVDLQRYVTRYELAQHDATQARSQAVGSLTAAFAARMQDTLAADPDFLTKAAAITSITPVSALEAGTVAGPLNYAAEEILRSEAPAAVLRHLVEHPDVLDALAKGTPRDAIRTIAQIDARALPSSVPASPVVKTTTSAPPPPQTLGTRPATSGDELEEAIRTGDMRAYRRLQNAREAAG